ncbi:MAG: hypothetical protein M1828_007509 [Chrysothrix sp. TS-e1954]|nr:MAG: hypothetical protein M1828_007509 [Chrysothrix sp. TS-e1954]
MTSCLANFSLRLYARAGTRGPKRLFSTSSSREATSPLFALGALSNSRESRWLSKASGISPVEYSPQLQLIRSSEIDPTKHNPRVLAPSRQGAPRQQLPARRHGATAALDVRAIRVGYAVLDSHRKAAERFRRSVRVMRTKHERQIDAWQRLNGKLVRENRIASFWVLVSVGVATIAALWKAKPPSRSVDINARAQSLWRSRLLHSGSMSETLNDDATPINETIAEAQAEMDAELPKLHLQESVPRESMAPPSNGRAHRRSWLWAAPSVED